LAHSDHDTLMTGATDDGTESFEREETLERGGDIRENGTRCVIAYEDLTRQDRRNRSKSQNPLPATIEKESETPSRAIGKTYSQLCTFQNHCR